MKCLWLDTCRFLNLPDETLLLVLQTAPDGWKNSVRHNLSLNKCFEKVENKTSSSSRKGCLWALNPAKIDKMEEEMQKWKRKDLPAIRRSMANPGQEGASCPTCAGSNPLASTSTFICVFLHRRAGQADHRPAGELQAQGFGARDDAAARLPHRPPAAHPCAGAASTRCHAVPALSTHAPAPPASGAAPGTGPSGAHVPSPRSDPSSPHGSGPLPQSSRPATRKAPG